MAIEVKVKNATIIFDDWKTGDPTFMWYRDLLFVNDGEFGSDSGAGIVLLQFNGLWAIRFFAALHFYVIHEAYKLMYPNGKDWLFASEDVDRLLHRVSSLKVFL